MGEKTKFIIIASAKNNEAWMDRHIKSVLAQKYKNYLYFFLNDVSADNTVNIYNKLVKNDNRFNIIDNVKEEKTADFSIKTRLKLFKDLNFSDEVVFVYLDGDDWFFSTDVLQHLNDIYRENNIWLTYGNFVEYPSGKKSSIISEYPPHIIKNNLYRKDAWRASHLKTFKKKIAKNLEMSDFLLGNNLTFVGDQAIMLSLLEMAGGRHKCIKKILYVYNRANPNNYDKKGTHAVQEMLRQEREIRQKIPREAIK